MAGSKILKGLLISIILLSSLLLVSTAYAFTWSNVGGNPLILGGVHSKAAFKHDLFTQHIQLGFKLVIKYNKQPSWVLPSALHNVVSNHIYLTTLTRGTHIGAMASGRGTIAISNDTVYEGRQYAHLPVLYTVASKTTRVSIKQVLYDQTISYRVVLAEPCGNAFVYNKTLVNKLVPIKTYPLYVEKRLNSATGSLLSGWTISGMVGKNRISKVTSSTNSTFVGNYPAGTAINLNESSQANWIVIFPANGNYKLLMPTSSLILVWVNSYICPTPTPTCTPTPTPTCTPTPTPTPTCSLLPKDPTTIPTPPPPPPDPPQSTPTPLPTVTTPVLPGTPAPAPPGTFSAVMLTVSFLVPPFIW